MTRSTPSIRFVNDLHSKLNCTPVGCISTVRSVADIRSDLAEAKRRGLVVAVAGGRYAMGGQQFVTGGMLLDTREFAGLLDFDAQRGLVTVEAGMQWPELIGHLQRLQPRTAGDAGPAWSIVQKQTGADRFSIGGSLAANVHGRGLTMKPIIADVEAFDLITADGEQHHCSRTENVDLFGLAIGGYGLFGVISAVTLRLAPRRKLLRAVEIASVEGLCAKFDACIAAGAQYGDFQFAIDPASADFLSLGVLSCYLPLPDDTPIPADQLALAPADWMALLELAHTDKTEAFRRYADFYLASAGQIYDSDTQQLSFYRDDYHLVLDEKLGHVGSEVISELYVPRQRLSEFMRAAAADLRAHGVDVIYGSVRLIRRDDESFLPWAQQDSACVIFNLHVQHNAGGLAAAGAAFRRLIDLAAALGGSYQLTYHRHATPRQLRKCHPNFEAFLALKLEHDPEQRFQSDWYRHCKALLADQRKSDTVVLSRQGAYLL